MDIHFQQHRSTSNCKPTIREHSAFWLNFAAIALVGLLLAGAAFATFGVAPAAFILCLELTAALAVGIL